MTHDRLGLMTSAHLSLLPRQSAEYTAAWAAAHSLQLEGADPCRRGVVSDLEPASIHLVL